MSSLTQSTLALLRNRPKWLTMRKIEEETGLSRHWLSTFMYQRNNEFGTGRVEVLHSYLLGITMQESE